MPLKLFLPIAKHSGWREPHHVVPNLESLFGRFPVNSSSWEQGEAAQQMETNALKRRVLLAPSPSLHLAARTVYFLHKEYINHQCLQKRENAESHTNLITTSAEQDHITHVITCHHSPAACRHINTAIPETRRKSRKVSAVPCSQGR